MALRTDIEKFLAETELSDEQRKEKRFKVLEALATGMVATLEEHEELRALRRERVLDRLRKDGVL